MDGETNGSMASMATFLVWCINGKAWTPKKKTQSSEIRTGRLSNKIPTCGERKARISVRGSPLLLKAGDALLQTADLGFLFIQDQDKPRIELSLQSFFASSITL